MKPHRRITPQVARAIYQDTGWIPCRVLLHYQENGVNYGCPIGTLAWKGGGEDLWTLEEACYVINMDQSYGAGFSCGWDGSHLEYLLSKLMNQYQYHQGYRDGLEAARIIGPITLEGTFN